MLYFLFCRIKLYLHNCSHLFITYPFCKQPKVTSSYRLPRTLFLGPPGCPTWPDPDSSQGGRLTASAAVVSGARGRHAGRPPFCSGLESRAVTCKTCPGNGADARGGDRAALESPPRRLQPSLTSLPLRPDPGNSKFLPPPHFTVPTLAPCLVSPPPHPRPHSPPSPQETRRPPPPHHPPAPPPARERKSRLPGRSERRLVDLVSLRPRHAPSVGRAPFWGAALYAPGSLRKLRPQLSRRFSPAIVTRVTSQRGPPPSRSVRGSKGVYANNLEVQASDW